MSENVIKTDTAEIDRYYFGSEVTEITIPEQIKKIACGACANSKNLTTVYFNAVNCGTCGNQYVPAFGSFDISESISYGGSWFANGGTTNVQDFYIGDKVQKLPSYLLTGTNVESVYIPKSVKKISPAAFYKADNLKEIVVDQDNPAYIVENGVLIEKKTATLLCVPAKKRLPKTYVVPDKITALGDYALFGHKEVKTVKAHSGVVKFGKYLHTYAEIEQESDVKIAPMPNTNVIGTKLMRCKGFSYRQPNVDKFVVSDGITEIADHAFDKVGRIHHVIFPESVSVFGKNIFQDSDINIITILNSTPKFTSVAMIKSNVEWLEVMYGKKKIWIYLPNTCSAPRRSRVISSLTLDEEGHVKLDSSYIMVDQIGATDEFLRAYCLISQEELLEQVTLIYPDDTNKEKKLEWEKERLTDKLRQYMKQGAEYCLKNGILSLSDFEMLFKLGAITKTNVNYLMEFAAKYGQGDIVDFLFNTVKGGKGKKPEMIEVEKLSITYPHVINLTGNMYNGKAKNAEGISVGDKLILEADRDNPWFHPVAVEVFNSKKEPLGYLGYTAASNIIQQIADDLENIDAVVETVTPLSAKIAANPNTRSKSADMTIKLIKKC